MIRIRKPSTAPDVLRTRGVAERRGNSLLYNRFAHEYQQGQRHFDFDPNIYGHPSVKDALSLAQHGKCCYCESKILHIDYGDVEHFRPKAAYCQDNASSLQRPGYYWLAYDWHNLYLSCTLCNQKHKRNFSPLHDPVHRAHSHRHDLRQPEFDIRKD